MFSLPNRPVSNGLNMTAAAAAAAAATTNSLVNVKQLTTTRPSLVERIKDNVRYNYNHYSASIKDNIIQPTQSLPPPPPPPLKWSSSSSSLSSASGGGAAGDRRSVFYTDPDLAATTITTTTNNSTAEKVSHVTRN